MIFDTHTHLYLPEFEDGGEAAVKRAFEAGVERLMFPNVDLTTIAPMRELQARHPQQIFMAMGLHPTEVNSDWEQALSAVESELRTHLTDYKAIGEIGIDLYWDKTFRQEQLEVFGRQVDWANELGLPIIIHCREGLDEVLEVLKSRKQVPRGVFHSFGGTVEDVERIRAVGDFYFGINGIVTFKNSKLREVLPAIGLDRIVLETDSPYLAPVPHRGKHNESAFIVNTAATVAQAIGEPLEKVEKVTTSNANHLFGIE